MAGPQSSWPALAVVRVTVMVAVAVPSVTLASATEKVPTLSVGPQTLVVSAAALLVLTASNWSAATVALFTSWLLAGAVTPVATTTVMLPLAPAASGRALAVLP